MPNTDNLDKHSAGKWTFLDVFLLVLEVVLPIVAILVSSFVKKDGELLNIDARLSIIVVGLLAPFAITQFTLKKGQNKNEKDIQNLKNTLDDIDDKLIHIIPIMKQAFLTGNDRAKRFVYRRMDEVTRTISTALGINNSGNLRPSEYYEELLYLAKLIIDDHTEQKGNFRGEVWAMTSFANEEWIEDEGYEKLWTEKLTEIADKNIKTRRLCVVSDDIYNIISSSAFSKDEAEKIKAFKSFISYLKAYYSSAMRKKIVENYFIRASDNLELTQIRGFFAIRLSSGELHILHGETVNESGALTAKVLFDPYEIGKIHELFGRYTRPTLELGMVVTKTANNNGFINYLKSHGVTF